MSNETMPLVMQANCQMMKIWQMPAMISVTFHLKSTRKRESFQKSRNRFVGTLVLGPCVFYQFAGNPGRDGSERFVNINIDDIATFIVALQKPFLAQSPAKPASS